MVKLIISIFVMTLNIVSLVAQSITDEQALVQILEGGKVEHGYKWNFKDTTFKKLALSKLNDPSIPKTKKGIEFICGGATLETYDSIYDRQFLKHLLLKTPRVDSILDGATAVRNFLKSDYTNEGLRLLSFYSNPRALLYWKSWTPYYLSFLGISPIDSTLLFYKKNFKTINEMHNSLYKKYIDIDTTEINVCLVRLGKLDDTIAIKQIEISQNKRFPNEYLKYFEYLVKMRTKNSFKKIGDYLISDLNHITSSQDRNSIRQMALSTFIAYVKNFPDRSTKWEDTFNIWAIVKFSRSNSKAYATDAYMEMAKKWYIENKDNLVLDMDKY